MLKVANGQRQTPCRNEDTESEFQLREHPQHYTLWKSPDTKVNVTLKRRKCRPTQETLRLETADTSAGRRRIIKPTKCKSTKGKPPPWWPASGLEWLGEGQTFRSYFISWLSSKESFIKLKKKVSLLFIPVNTIWGCHRRSKWITNSGGWLFLLTLITFSLLLPTNLGFLNLY